MLEKIKQNPSLFIGFAIPIFMVLFIAGVIYLPRILNSTVPPAYDFVYAAGDGVIYPSYGANGAGYYPYPIYSQNGARLKYTYRVADGKVIKEESRYDQNPNDKGAQPLWNTTVVDIEPKFYVYHVAEEKSQALTYDEVSKLKLDSGPKSQDGYELVRGSYGGGDIFPFFYGGSGDYNSQYLKKGSYARKIELDLPQNYYNVFFLGWVMK